MYTAVGCVVSFVGLPSIAVGLSGAEWTALPFAEKLVHWIRWGVQGIVILTLLGALIGFVIGAIVDLALDALETPMRPEQAPLDPPSFDRIERREPG